MFKKIINSLEGVVSEQNNIAYKNALNLLIDNYKKISEEVEIIDFDTKKNSHYIELRLGEDFFFEININRKSLHIIINGLEEMFFFEDNSFVSLSENVLNALFEGNYRVIEYKDQKSKSVIFALRFKGVALASLNKEIKGLNEEADIINITEGKKLVALSV